MDPVLDERLAAFVVDSHARCTAEAALGQEVPAAAGEEEEEGLIAQDLLRKYIRYAKEHVHPKLQAADHDRIARVYADLRRESTVHAGMPIAVRHLESMIRISEAHARMHLREYVTSDDVDMAIKVMVESYVSTQKHGTQQALRQKFRRYITHRADMHDLALYLLRQLVRDQLRLEEYRGIQEDDEVAAASVRVRLRDLRDKCREYECEAAIDSVRAPCTGIPPSACCSCC